MHGNRHSVHTPTICTKKLRNKKEYNVKKDWIGRKKHYKCYKKEMDDNCQKVMLANWLLTTNNTNNN